MEDELGPFIEQHKIIVERRYIDNDAALEALYGEKVPVLTLDEEILCHYFLDTDVLMESIRRAE